MYKPSNDFSAALPRYVFGRFELEPAERTLRKDGQPVPLTPKVFETLVLLVEQQGRVLEKDLLLRTLWPDTVVEEVNLAHNISRLRKALGEEAGGEKFIETVPKLGYRFVAPVEIETAAKFVLEKLTVSETLTEEEVIRVMSEPLPTPVVETLPFTQPAASRRPRWLLWVSAGAALLLLGMLLGPRLNSARGGEAPIKAIAVLPLESLSSNEPEAGVLGAGFADVLATRLGGLRGINVRPLRSVLKYEDHPRDDAAIGRELQVEALVTGSLQRAGDRLRLTLRLVNVAEGRTLWAGQFDEKLADLLVVQDTVADKVVEALALNLTPPEKQALARRFTQDADAQHLYEKGYFLLQRQRYLDKAAAYLRLALEKDPNFALAFSRLGEVQTHQTVPAAPGTWELLNKALELEPELAEGWAALGFYQMFQAWDWAAAEKSLRRALELKPGYAKAHQWYADWLAIHRRLPEATVELEAALAIDPTSPNLLTDLGELHLFARAYDQALGCYRQALALDPEFFAAHAQLADLYWRTGQEEAAFEAYAQWRRLEIRASFGAEYDEAADRTVFAQGGFKAVLKSKHTVNAARMNNEPAMSGWVARETASLGDRAQTLHWIERATSSHRGGYAMPYLGIDPIYDSLRNEPRFQAALRQVGLAGQ